MAVKDPVDFFDKQASASYDQRAEKLGAINSNLHLLIDLVLSDLPSRARILCAGAGTGTEILYLAKQRPGWSFVGLDPSQDMLDVCKSKLEAQGIMPRCRLLNGYMSDLPQGEKFDAVLCLLVTHFIKDSDERQRMFDKMESHLKPGGYLINADISYDMSAPEFESMAEKWIAMHKKAGSTDEQAGQMMQALKDHVSVLPAASVENFLRTSGFEMPVEFFQSFFIRAWYSKKK